MSSSTGSVSSRFHEAMAAARIRLPLPSEIQAGSDQDMSVFIDGLRTAVSNADIIARAHLLNQQEIRMIFPALAGLESSDKKLQDRIFLLIRERASMSMYNSGWLIFQQSPDNQIVQRALALLCSILEIKRQTYPREPKYESAKLPAGELPLISQILPPNSRQFAKRLSLALAARRLKTKDFAKQYGLQAETRLAAELSALELIAGRNFDKENILKFEHAIRLSGDQLRAELVQSFLNTQNISDLEFQSFCPLIRRELGAPWEDNLIWQQIKDREKAIYSQWCVRNSIETHCRDLEAKQSFYLRYLDKIDRIEQWSDDTILIYFDYFVLADNKQNPDTAMYYGRKQATEHPYELAGGLAETEPARDPASISVPHITCEEAISKAETGKIVVLYFNEAELRCSGAFLDFCLQSNRGATSGLRWKLFN
jgi:hypothetical protein